MLNGLDLFSGIGGIAYALSPWVTPRAYCEIDRYAQAVLLSRMADGKLAGAPIWDDVRTLSKGMLPAIDIIYGGFPCQDISTAGCGVGLEGERSGLVFEVFRLIREIGPSFVFLENVPAIRTRGGERVVKELAALGYDCRWDCLSAFDMGAPHKRERWFLLAHRDGLGLRQQSNAISECKETALPGNDGAKESMADAASKGRSDIGSARQWIGESPRCGWWASEPDVGRVAYGVPQRLDRIRGLGNAVVPAQAREAFRRLMGR